MKTLLFAFVTISTISIVSAQTNPKTRYQSGYVKPSSGKYVDGHFKTEVNETNHDNFSTKSNTNTNTSKKGSIAKDYSSGAFNYGSGQTIHTGSKGGQYYINSNGNKTYVPKR